MCCKCNFDWIKANLAENQLKKWQNVKKTAFFAKSSMSQWVKASSQLSVAILTNILAFFINFCSRSLWYWVQQNINRGIKPHNKKFFNLVPRVSHLTAPWGDRGETVVGSGHMLLWQLKTSRFPWQVERVDLSSCNWVMTASGEWDINSAYLSLCRGGMTRQSDRSIVFRWNKSVKFTHALHHD